jgi:hypothetical protein
MAIEMACNFPSLRALRLGGGANDRKQVYSMQKQKTTTNDEPQYYRGDYDKQYDSWTYLGN